MTIMERIYALAEPKGIKKADIYNNCGIPQSSFSVWTNANPESIPSEYIPALAKYLGVSCDELLTGEKPMLDLPENQVRLLTGFSSLDWDGQQMVLAALIAEKRRMESMEG